MRITGTVRDAETDQPVASAQVALHIDEEELAQLHTRKTG